MDKIYKITAKTGLRQKYQVKWKKINIITTTPRDKRSMKKKKMLFLKDHDKNLGLNKAMKLRLYD